MGYLLVQNLFLHLTSTGLCNGWQVRQAYAGGSRYMSGTAHNAGSLHSAKCLGNLYVHVCRPFSSWRKARNVRVQGALPQAVIAGSECWANCAHPGDAGLDITFDYVVVLLSLRVTQNQLHPMHR